MNHHDECPFPRRGEDNLCSCASLRLRDLTQDQEKLLKLVDFLLGDACEDASCACCETVRSSVPHTLSKLSTPRYAWDSRAGRYVALPTPCAGDKP
jgi:hypothetical protein